jgi:hypothetical protein
LGQGPQKVDSGGNFYMTPRRVTGSVAWRELSFRARAILQVFQYSCDGHNNGELAFGIHEIGKMLGNQSHGLNARAVAELIEKGFLECTSDANRSQGKVRTYRITFISTGRARGIEPATHDYETWRPVKKRKFGGARTAPESAVSVVVTAPKVKDSGAVTAPQVTESRGFVGQTLGEGTALLLDNHSAVGWEDVNSSFDPMKIPAADLRTEVDTLRQWALQVVYGYGYGGARRLACEAAIPEVALSRFRAGKGLPDHYRIALQEACARAIPFHKFALIAEAA